MGMDIYLEDRESRARRDRARKRFEHLVMLRDEEKDESRKKSLHRQVLKSYDVICSAENGYFRVNYNDYSISYWLQYNVDKQAKGEWGLEPFYSAVKGMKKPVIRSERFRQELLTTARRWYNSAVKLKDKESYLFALDTRKSDFDKGEYVRSKVVLKGKQTNGYIVWLRNLVVFAELAVKHRSPIYVSY
jgi:hypothetical protein